MCRFQKEINSKIQEKKALEILADSTSTVSCSTESTEGQGPNPRLPCDRTLGVMHKLEEAPDGQDGNTHSLEDGSSEAEQNHYCGGESVGTACLHDLCAAWLPHCVCLYNLSVQMQMEHAPNKYSK